MHPNYLRLAIVFTVFSIMLATPFVAVSL